MGRALLVLHTDEIRAKAMDWIDRAPVDTRVTFQGPKRTLPQNDRMWAMLTDIADQLEWVERKHHAEVWKKLLFDLFDHERGTDPDLIPALHGEGFVRLGLQSSDFSIEEMTQFIEFLFAFGTERGVIFHEPEDGPRPARKRKGKDDG